MKRDLIISGIILLCTIVGVILFFVFYDPRSEEEKIRSNEIKRTLENIEIEDNLYTNFHKAINEKIESLLY